MRALVLSVPAADLELASDRLRLAGACAIEERQVIGDDPADLVALWTVIAADDHVSLDRLGALPPSWTAEFSEVAIDAAESWRDHVHPVVVCDDLVVRPAWLAPRNDPDPDVVEVVIEPGASFGLGDHPTTRLSAFAVWRLVRPGSRVLDVGCGSGVLSIIAGVFGARRVTAVDISAAAVDATLDNAVRNGVDDRIDAGTDPIDSLAGPYDLVLANILAPTLVSMAGELKRLTASSGRLVISGVLEDESRHRHVLEALEPMVVDETSALDGWAAVTLRHP